MLDVRLELEKVAAELGRDNDPLVPHSRAGGPPSFVAVGARTLAGVGSLKEGVGQGMRDPGAGAADAHRRSQARARPDTAVFTRPDQIPPSHPQGPMPCVQPGRWE